MAQGGVKPNLCIPGTQAVADQIGAMAEQAMRQLIQLQSAVAGSKDVLRDAASTMNAIKPNN